METKQIAAALVKAQMEMQTAIKDSKNPFFKSNYADLNSIREACVPALNKHGIVLLQPIVQVNEKNYVKTLLLHESGESIECLTEIIYSKANDAQAQGSGITYARRYGMQSLCCIAADDDDANSTDGTKIMFNQMTIIENLLSGSSIAQEEKELIERNMSTFTVEKAAKCIDYLKTSQVDRIEGGMGYSVTDVNKKVAAKLNDERA